jgi:archaellum component FlaF (FlaF/FlaG flagellin family)
VIVFEGTFVFDAGTAEVVVIAEFVVGGTLFDALEDSFVDV